MNTERIFKKIETLGGVESLVNVKGKVLSEGNSEKSTRELSSIEFPDVYLEISKKYGSFSFKKWVVFFKMIGKIPAIDENYISVDNFYSIDDAIVIKGQYQEQLPYKMLPVFDGEPGDLICIIFLAARLSLLPEA